MKNNFMHFSGDFQKTPVLKIPENSQKNTFGKVL